MDYKSNPEDELAEIQNVFGVFFVKHGFRLKSADRQEIVFENGYSELLFDFDNYGMRWGYMAPPAVIYKNKRSGKRYAVKSLMNQLQGIDFEALFNVYWHTQQLGYYETWHKMIADYLDGIIGDSAFLWEGKLTENP
ncbi:hypothetical protein OGH69_04020 [Flavobacterium sp. MFBS3-15]|uniref:hypothetical protein n=1 Tax=Flavobacterium sp. MFBS3-15 TaxID=2989816 RepID=UPI0022367B32|nr:hypothetical protein [Flavobacterium sp. MFBS3-15]MCW4468122.1 hypothetical protein [Flavobacterium sp. MFBS3-15]